MRALDAGLEWLPSQRLVEGRHICEAQYLGANQADAGLLRLLLRD